jgi:hypothetical protein
MPHYFYRNNGNANDWIAFKLVGTVSNRSGIGAKIRVQATIGGRTIWQMRELCRGNLAQDDLRVHFGLGEAANARVVRIEWPSGIVQELTDVPARQFLTITEHQEYGDPPPRFNSVTPSPAGCQIVIGEPAANARYMLEASPDLVTWTKLLARTSAGGAHEFLDVQAANHARRFYRLVVP